jgi:hypothetical protein
MSHPDPLVTQHSGLFTLVTSPKLKWHDASLSCLANGGNLASIRSQEENDIVAGMCGAEDCWIGFNDVLHETSWVWNDGWTGAYTNWQPGEPNGQSAEDTDGAYIASWTTGGKWDDTDVLQAKAYVCRTTAIPIYSPPPGPPGSGTCFNTCTFSGDGDCDDGGTGSEYTACTSCTDCDDCGPRSGCVFEPPSPPSPPFEFPEFCPPQQESGGGATGWIAVLCLIIGAGLGALAQAYWSKRQAGRLGGGGRARLSPTVVVSGTSTMPLAGQDFAAQTAQPYRAPGS